MQALEVTDKPTIKKKMGKLRVLWNDRTQFYLTLCGLLSSNCGIRDPDAEGQPIHNNTQMKHEDGLNENGSQVQILVVFHIFMGWPRTAIFLISVSK
jgi:hypothetical protein